MLNSLQRHLNEVLGLVRQGFCPGSRFLLAVAGPPGSGKSTLAEAVVTALNAERHNTAALLPMDGFHLDTEILETLGLVARRGAPETFDAQGFVELIQSVRTAKYDIHYPVYDRSQERAIPNGATLPIETEIVVAEGNYLLLNHPIWKELHPLFDARVFLSCEMDTLEKRLMDRWLGYGYNPVDAARKVQGNDLRNAKLVNNESIEADLTLYEDTDS